MEEAKTLKPNNWSNIGKGLCPACDRTLVREVKKVTRNIKYKEPMFGDGGMLEIMVEKTGPVHILIDRMKCICGFKMRRDKFNNIQKERNDKADTKEA